MISKRLSVLGLLAAGLAALIGCSVDDTPICRPKFYGVKPEVENMGVVDGSPPAPKVIGASAKYGVCGGTISVSIRTSTFAYAYLSTESTTRRSGSGVYLDPAEHDCEHPAVSCTLLVNQYELAFPRAFNLAVLDHYERSSPKVLVDLDTLDPSSKPVQR